MVAMYYVCGGVATKMLRLSEGGVFITYSDTENQCLINHKTVCGERNRPFCQTVVIRCGYFKVSGFFHMNVFSQSCYYALSSNIISSELPILYKGFSMGNVK